MSRALTKPAEPVTGDQISLEYYMDVPGQSSASMPWIWPISTASTIRVCRTIWMMRSSRYREMPGQESHYRELEQRHPKLDELPFAHDERRFASVLVRGGTSKTCSSSKAAWMRSAGSAAIFEHRGERHLIDAHGRDSVHAIVDETLEDGMKVLAVAYKPLNQETISQDDENGLTLLGVSGIL